MSQNEEFFDCQDTTVTSATDYRQETRTVGAVKWFNAKSGFGFITRNDDGETVFVHQKSIVKKNPNHAVESLCDGEQVEFNVMAVDVTGIGRKPVRGNPSLSFIPIRCRNFNLSSDGKRIKRSYDRNGNSRIPRYSPIYRSMESEK